MNILDRSKYFEICQKVAILPSGILGMKENVPDELLVDYMGINYYPIGYELTFDNKGNTKHKAILHDLKASCIIYANLERIKDK